VEHRIGRLDVRSELTSRFRYRAEQHRRALYGLSIDPAAAFDSEGASVLGTSTPSYRCSTLCALSANLEHTLAAWQHQAARWTDDRSLARAARRQDRWHNVYRIIAELIWKASLTYRR